MSSDSSLDSLLAGVRRFRSEIYPQHRERYERVVRKAQEPHTLFITCSDSRIDPELLTQSGPGDIFVLRNVGNLVPAYGEMLGGVSAVIEYAVLALKVSHIVVCGHTDCGAMKGLLHREKLAAMPTVNAWLNNAAAALSIVKARNTAIGEHAEMEQLISENVLLQLNHLRTHPSVAGRIAEGKLTVHGWVYDIGNGDVKIFDNANHQFVSIDSQPARGASI